MDFGLVSMMFIMKVVLDGVIILPLIIPIGKVENLVILIHGKIMLHFGEIHNGMT